VGDTPPHDSGDPGDDGYPSDDGHGDLSGLEFFTPEYPPEASDLDAFEGFAGEVHADEPATEPLSDEGLPVPLFTVTNPPGTVTVTSFIDGRINQIELSPKVTTMTETHLAEEIVVIARLATQDARSAQYAFMLEGMKEQGHDNVTTRDFLSRDLDLPSPEQAKAARAEVFATRYVGDHE
jgi:hypothetical protein